MTKKLMKAAYTGTVVGVAMLILAMAMGILGLAAAATCFLSVGVVVLALVGVIVACSLVKDIWKA